MEVKRITLPRDEEEFYLVAFSDKDRTVFERAMETGDNYPPDPQTTRALSEMGLRAGFLCDCKVETRVYDDIRAAFTQETGQFNGRTHLAKSFVDGVKLRDLKREYGKDLVAVIQEGEN